VEADTAVKLTATIAAGTGGEATSTTKDFDLTVKTYGTISSEFAVVSIGSGFADILNVSAVADSTDSDGSHTASVRHKVCIGVDDAAALNSSSGMDGAIDKGACSTAFVSPVTLGTTETACCTMASVTSTMYFKVPSGTKTWRARVYGYVHGDPSEAHHKNLYSLSSSAVNP
jgi:hypothetical protein